MWTILKVIIIILWYIIVTTKSRKPNCIVTTLTGFRLLSVWGICKVHKNYILYNVYNIKIPSSWEILSILQWYLCNVHIYISIYTYVEILEIDGCKKYFSLLREFVLFSHIKLYKPHSRSVWVVDYMHLYGQILFFLVRKIKSGRHFCRQVVFVIGTGKTIIVIRIYDVSVYIGMM